MNHIKVFVAMSGGVDSSVAAFLLKNQGYEVTGVYMKNWSDPLADYCPWKSDIKDFRLVCRKLKIKSRIEIFEDEYRKKVVNYLIRGYRQGITPNPDMLCNREIKFELFLKKCLSLGADFIATGHYVIKEYNKSDKFQLYRAKDLTKDQSYFLALLNQRQLKYSLFPVGQYLKTQIRQIAKNAQLPVFNKKDSQGICFIGNVKFKKFIRQFIKPKSGLIKSTNGKIIGHHDGAFYYTIGQRHGLNIGGGTPYYIVKKEIKSNTLFVDKKGPHSKLFNKKIQINNINWISEKSPSFPLSCQAQIRYRQLTQKCTIYKQNKNNLINFDKPQMAITPGQFAVLYKNSCMLGGGEISNNLTF